MRKKNLLLLCQVLFFLLCILLYPYLKYNFEADGISYISIAHHYANFDFQNAINGTWSPLISICMSPLILAGIDPLVGFRVINVFFGLLLLWQVDKLADNLSMGSTTKFALLIVTIANLLFWSLHFTQADLLPVFFLTLYTNLLLSAKEKLSYSQLVLIAATGFFAYFSKSYNLLFFILHFTFFCLLLLYLKKYRLNLLLKKYFFTLSVFLLFSSSWIIPLNKKYKKITISNAGRYNHLLALFNPYGEHIHNRHLCKRTLIPPLSGNSISAWEDVANFGDDEKKWSDASLITLLKLQVQLSYINVCYLNKLLIKNNLIFFLFFIFFFFLKKKVLTYSVNLNFLILFSLFFLFPIGYLLVIVSSRYIWFMYLLMIVLIFYIIDDLLIKKGQLNNTQRVLLIGLTSILLIARPIRQITLLKYKGKDLYNLVETIKPLKAIKKGDNIASFNNWDRNLNLSYLLGLKYYGQTKHYRDEDELKMVLITNQVDYFISDSKSKEYSFLKEKKVIVDLPSEGIKIYKLN